MLSSNINHSSPFFDHCIDQRKPQFNENGFQNIWLTIKQMYSSWNGSKWWKAKLGESNFARANMLCDVYTVLQPFTTYIILSEILLKALFAIQNTHLETMLCPKEMMSLKFTTCIEEVMDMDMDVMYMSSGSGCRNNIHARPLSLTLCRTMLHT